MSKFHQIFKIPSNIYLYFTFITELICNSFRIINSNNTDLFVFFFYEHKKWFI